METNKEGEKSNIGFYSGFIVCMLFASFLYNKLNQPTKEDVNNQINVPSVNPTYDLDPKPAAYNNFSSGNRLNPYKVDVDYPEININEYPKFEGPKYNMGMGNLPHISGSGELNSGFQKILDTLSY
jgi:hypothetical protein